MNEGISLAKAAAAMAKLRACRPVAVRAWCGT